MIFEARINVLDFLNKKKKEVLAVHRTANVKGCIKCLIVSVKTIKDAE